MAKKNPYVTTIGFNKEDPDHVYVADFLNSMGRGKGQYIVKAIMAYQNTDGVVSGHVVVPAVDYEKIRAFVLKVLEERNGLSMSSHMDRISEKVHKKEFDGCGELERDSDLDETAVNNILASLSAFR
ncbi:MAG: hypothetical protein IKJ39_12545 [Lachnospiraceae bacterium]|nr:hypothetical protein [Lachnospiraceae bacterium]MBR3826015.1 hypothetical protein [Lachnospiraceae bacterium]